MVYSPLKYRETEGIKVRRLGYDLSQTRLKAIALELGITKAFNAMSQAEKSQLRYYAIMTQVTTAQGDMARTLNAPANQLRILQAQVTQAARAIGQIFIPILNAILPPVIAAIKALRALASTFASFFGYSLPEVDYSGIQSAASAADDLAGGLGNAAGAAKKLKDYTMGFDELNVLNADSGSGGSGGGGSGGGGVSDDMWDFDLPTYDFLGDAVTSKVDEIFGKIEPFITFLEDHLNVVISAVEAIGAGLAMWKIAKSFGVELGHLTQGFTGLAASAAVIAIGTKVHFDLEKAFLSEDGSIVQELLAIGETGFTSFIAYAIAKRAFPGWSGAGLIASGLTLGLAVITDLVALKGSVETDGVSWKTVASGIGSAIEGATAGVLIAKALGASLLMGGLVGFGITAAAVTTVAVKSVLAKKADDAKFHIQWGSETLTPEELNTVIDGMFQFDVKSKIRLIDTTVENASSSQQELNRQVEQFNATLFPIKLGVEVDQSLYGTLLGQVENIVSATQETLNNQKDTVSLYVQLGVTSGTLSEEDGASILGNITGSVSGLNQVVTNLGYELTSLLEKGWEQGLTDHEQQMLLDLTETMNAIQVGYKQGELRGSFNYDVATLLGELDEESFNSVIDQFTEQEQKLYNSLVEIDKQSYNAVSGQLGSWTEYYNALLGDPDATQEQIDAAKAQVDELTATLATWKTTMDVDKIFEGMTGEGRQMLIDAVLGLFDVDFLGKAVKQGNFEQLGYLLPSLLLGDASDPSNLAHLQDEFNSQVDLALQGVLSADAYANLKKFSDKLGLTLADIIPASNWSGVAESLLSAGFDESTINTLLEPYGVIFKNGIVSAIADELGGNKTATEISDAVEDATDGLEMPKVAVPTYFELLDSDGNQIDGIMDMNGVVDNVNVKVSLLKSGWTSIQSWIGNTAITAKVTLPNIDISLDKTTVGEMANDKLRLKFVTQYAEGGMPKSGELFMAREAGNEFVGRIGSKSAVGNNEQIVEGITNGVSTGNEPLLNALYSLIDVVENKNMTVSIGDREIGESNDRYNAKRGARVDKGVYANAY